MTNSLILKHVSLIKHSIVATCVTANLAASLRCVNCSFVNKTQYSHLCDGESCGLPEVREYSFVNKTQYNRHLCDGESCGLPEVRELQFRR